MLLLKEEVNFTIYTNESQPKQKLLDLKFKHINNNPYLFGLKLIFEVNKHQKLLES
jgi:hypothetical protein